MGTLAVETKPLHGIFLGKRHNRVHPGHFATQQGTPFYPAGMSAADWSTLVFTLPRRKMAWVHPVVSFPLSFLFKLTTRVMIYFNPIWIIMQVEGSTCINSTHIINKVQAWISQILYYCMIPVINNEQNTCIYMVAPVAQRYLVTL